MYHSLVGMHGAAGGAERFIDLKDAIQAMMNKPELAALKFTWAGDQDKTVASLVLSNVTLTAELIGPFLEDRPEMHNDFEALYFLKTKGSTMQLMAETLLENQAKLAPSESLQVMLTIIANLGEPGAAYITAGVHPADLSTILAAAINNIDEGTQAALGYLQLNMGG